MTSPPSEHRPVVLVTGAAQRIGAAIARHLHAHGWNVALHYRTSAAAAERLAAALAAERPGSAAAFAADLADARAAGPLVAAVLERFGRLDALVNNASTFYPTALPEATPEQWEELMGANARAPFFLTQAAAAELARRRGAVVNVVDIHAERPLPRYPVYTAAKAALAGLTRALAVELAPAVRVNGVAPGAILWPEDGQYPPEERARILAQIPLQRLGEPSDIARAVRFLLEDAPYVTGQILAIDGGRNLAL
ncbi:MAG: pteridine reductase [Rhodocyclales bacterium]|nr:pteridine reductase [Rhodocyclales bacterium]